jgi:hypothetical protein
MDEIKIVTDVLNELGVASLFGPLFALILLSWLLKKYIFAGAGTIVKELITQYSKHTVDRISLETRIDLRLSELAVNIEKFITQLVELEKRNSERIAEMKRELTDRLHNLEYCLSDKVFGELADLRKLTEAQKADLRLPGQRKDDKQRLAMTDTEEFRKAREEARKDLLK